MTRRAKEQRQKRLEMRMVPPTPEEIERKRTWTELLKRIDIEQADEMKIQANRPRTQSAPQELQWKSSSAVIAASGKFRLPVRLEYVQAELLFEFTTKEFDITFSISFIDSNGIQQYLISPTRCASHEYPVKGKHDIKGPGMITLEWDNEYSWINSKQLCYTVQLRQSSTKKEVEIKKEKNVNFIIQDELRKRQCALHDDTIAQTELKSTVETLESSIDELEIRIAVRYDCAVPKPSLLIQTNSSPLFLCRNYKPNWLISNICKTPH